MIRQIALWTMLALAGGVALAADSVEFSSPGLPPSRMEASGQLIEDWGQVRWLLKGEGLPQPVAELQAINLDNVVPAARWTATQGNIRLTASAYRAPVFPDGMDVLTLRLENAADAEAKTVLALQITPQAKVGLSLASLDNRPVLAIPQETRASLPTRDWGYTIETTPMPGWAKPLGECDPAFRNIRAGMGGIPIAYRFRVEPRGKVQVVLGLCESHWDRPGIRPIICDVEGARPQIVDPLERWGRHQPGALPFAASDVDGDGWVDVRIKPVPNAADQNPILNVIWVFAADKRPNLARVVKGELNAQVRYYVDVGGQQDQPILAVENLEFPVNLPPRSAKELTFYVACGNGTVVNPDLTAWTVEALYHAACEVWQGWAGTARP